MRKDSPASTPQTLPQIPGGWKQEAALIGRDRIKLTLPANPNRLLDELDESSEGEVPEPYWGALWPAAEQLARRVLADPWPKGRSCLELGCGVGLVGVAGLMQGLEVVFSDNVPLSVEVALRNATDNGFPEAKGLVLDWRERHSGEFNFILGSDVCYDRAAFRALLETINSLLSARGLVWLGDPGRSSLTHFLELAESDGYAVKLLNADGRRVESVVGGEFRLVSLSRGGGQRR